MRAWGIERRTWIAGAVNRPRPEDWPIEDYAKAGLPFPSVVRPAKVTTIEAKNAEIIGRLVPAAHAEFVGRIDRLTRSQ